MAKGPWMGRPWDGATGTWHSQQRLSAQCRPSSDRGQGLESGPGVQRSGVEMASRHIKTSFLGCPWAQCCPSSDFCPLTTPVFSSLGVQGWWGSLEDAWVCVRNPCPRPKGQKLKAKFTKPGECVAVA